jgi:hypothetical protein
MLIAFFNHVDLKNCMKMIKHTCDHICSIVAPFMQKGRYINFKNVISLEMQIVIFTPNVMILKIT